MSAPLPLTEDEVVNLCTRSGPDTNRCVYPAINPLYFIKYRSTTMGEARTQSYVHDRTNDVPGGPRVPKIYHMFKREWCIYIVMEYINAPTVDEFLAEHPSKTESIHSSIASGLSWLLRLPLPRDMCLGPVGGGFAVHRFFGDYNDRAPLNFVHVAALQRYANEALRRTPGRGPKDSVDFVSEERCFYHSDIREPNFLVDPETEEITFVDFQHVGILTTSFASYGLHFGGPFIRDIATRIDFPESKQLRTMDHAASILVQFGGSKLGLNELGLSTRKVRRKTANDEPARLGNKNSEFFDILCQT